ncbi:MAG: transcription antitermination factor NusB [Clostridia bacterium]
MSEFDTAYEVLSNVYKKGAYSNIELNRVLFGQQSPQKITKIVYGVLEKNTQLDYYMSKLCLKKPQNTIAILIKMGMYCIKYMDSIPNYAVVDNCVELCNSIQKYQLKGFVNSVLKKFCDAEFDLPKDRFERLSVVSSTPL